MSDGTLTEQRGMQDALGTLSSVNADFDWDSFNSHSYSDHNYSRLRDDDHQILDLVRDFFGKIERRDLAGIDVGSGSNLYPALAMLPYCSSIDLREYSSSNVQWLKEQVECLDERWNQFWEVLAEDPAYRTVVNPREALSKTAHVTQQSIFDLPERQWSIGTMFFVACSISRHVAEFEKAVDRFVRSLTDDAPFAAAFMVGSAGYQVEGTWFPAAKINEAEVSRALESIAYNVTIYPISTQNPLRDGYGGMLLATGNRKPGF